MASQKEIAATYDWVDELFRETIGKHGDYTCAFYNGDYSKTLEEAQRDKHRYILKGIKFKKGDRVLDIGCGWGPFLKVVKNNGGTPVGLTLSPPQAKHCKNEGFEVYLKDYKKINSKKFGKFDCIVSVGAFEHFCSIKEYEEGNQEKIYRDFFKFCYNLLPKGRRMFLQTMIWGDKVPDPNRLSLKAKKGTPEFYVTLLSFFYPGSWLPKNLKQIEKCAKPYFKLFSSNNGRMDYIETLNQWTKKMNKLNPRLIWLKLKLLPKYLTDKKFRIQVKSVRNDSQTEVFKRNILTHERMIFEKI